MSLRFGRCVLYACCVILVEPRFRSYQRLHTSSVGMDEDRRLPNSTNIPAQVDIRPIWQASSKKIESGSLPDKVVVRVEDETATLPFLLFWTHQDIGIYALTFVEDLRVDLASR